jgi:N-acetylglucosaminyldiphosphoundecaprenol N-acetyl-beta-D-mannosaminyltransferase
MSEIVSNNKRVNVLGTGISITNMAETLATFDEWLTAGIKQYVCVAAVHGVMESYHDPKLRKIFNESGLSVPDGMPLVWAGKIYGHQRMGRVYGPDLMLEMCHRAIRKNYTHFLYGGTSGVAQKLRKTSRSASLELRLSEPSRRLFAL